MAKKKPVKKIIKKTSKKTKKLKKTAKTKPKKILKKKAVKPAAKKRRTVGRSRPAEAKKALSAIREARPEKPAAAADKKKEETRKQLIQLREAIVKEAKAEISKYIKGENKQIVDTALDDGDWANVDLSEDVSLKQLGTHRETLLKIDASLSKLDEGTYGLCEKCGEPISEERLKLMPFAIYCRDCQEEIEQLEAIEKELPI